MPRGTYTSPRIPLTLPEPLNTEIREQAEREGRPLSRLVQDALRDYLQKAKTMKTYRVGPSDFPADRSFRAFRITYPAGHFLNNDPRPGQTLTTYGLKAFRPVLNCPDPLDEQVVSEPILVQHPEYLNGASGEAQFIMATPQRVLHHLAIGKDTEELRTAA